MSFQVIFRVRRSHLVRRYINGIVPMRKCEVERWLGAILKEAPTASADRPRSTYLALSERRRRISSQVPVQLLAIYDV